MASDNRTSLEVKSTENLANSQNYNNDNNNSVNVNNNYKPGRKFGLTGSRQSSNVPYRSIENRRVINNSYNN